MNELNIQPSLGEFLRVARARLTPEQVGLKSYGRRRTPGLRREEVAQLANISVSWYTSIEQGKDRQPSQQVLECLSTALQLSPAEKHYLFLLSKSSEIEESEIYKEISIGLERTVFALDPNPAYILGKYWDVLLWNHAAEFIFKFPPFSIDLTEKPNMLYRFLTDPFLKEVFPDWEEHVKVMIARFRADCARYPNDKRLIEMISKYNQEIDIFRHWWPRYEIATVTDCHKLWNDPQIGSLEFEHVDLQLSNYPNFQLMIFTASPSTAAKLKQVI